jgi:lipid A disaccharide synthetase
MNEIETSQVTITRLAENPVYKQYVELSTIITEGKLIHEAIQFHQQRIMMIQQQQKAQEAQYQEQQVNQQQQQYNQQQMMATQYQNNPQAPQRGRPPMQKPVQQMPRQQVDSFGNPIAAPANNLKNELGIDEQPVEGIPAWNE